VSLRYALPQAAEAHLTVYDVEGRVVRVLERSALPAGDYSAHWDGRDAAGRDASTGMYLIRLDVPGRELMQKIMLLR